MTLLELLAAVFLLSMTALVMGQGVGMVHRVCQSMEKEAEAQQVLWITAELLSDELSGVFAEQTGADGQQWLFSQKSKDWMYLKADSEHGISRVFEAENGSEMLSPLLSAEAMGSIFYTDFEDVLYEDACFTITELAVYEKREEETKERVPLAVLPELTVHAVNLEIQKEPETGSDSEENAFTLPELLGVLAVLLLLASLLLPSVFRIGRQMTQLQMDRTAKELFLTVQGQLTLEASRGSLERLFSMEQENPEHLQEKIGIPADSDVYFVLYQPDGTENPTEEIRERLLPFGSIAERIRSEGSYLIAYEPHTARIDAVWYSESYGFSKEDFEPLAYSETAWREYLKDSDFKAVIGYYGR